MSDKIVRSPSVHALRKAGQRPKRERREHVATQQDQVESALPALPNDDRRVAICRIAVNPSATFSPTPAYTTADCESAPLSIRLSLSGKQDALRSFQT
jgi:hypothetical protein